MIDNRQKLTEMNEWKSIQKNSDQENKERSPQDLECEAACRCSTGPTRGDCIRCGHSGDPEKERENPVGEGTSIPLRMRELRIDVRPVAAVVDEHHCRHREPAKHIKRYQALRCFGG